MSNSGFTGIYSNTTSSFINATSINTTSLNAINVPSVGSTFIAQLPSSFYNNPFATGTAIAPILMVDLNYNLFQLPVGANYFLSGIQISGKGFGPGGGGSFKGPSSFYIGTCSSALASINFGSIINNNVPLNNNGQIEIFNNRLIRENASTTTFYVSSNFLSGVSTVGGDGSTAIETPSIPGFNYLYNVLTGVVEPNNYLCCYFDPLQTSTTTNAVGNLFIYFSIINDTPIL